MRYDEWLLDLISEGRFGAPHGLEHIFSFAPSDNPTPLPRPPGSRGRLIIGDERALRLGPDGGGRRQTPGAFRTAAQRKGARAWRGRLRLDAGIRALPAWL